MRVPLAKPEITPEDIDEINAVLRTDCLSIGPRVEAFEAAFCAYLGVAHAVAVNSGTSGLHVLVRALDIGPGDEVITTPFSFVASTNCILFERATPVFADIDPFTLNIDIDGIAAAITERTKMLLPVDVFGHPLPLPRLREIAARHGLKIVEDACEALGSEYAGVKAGTAADGAVFAFYPNKQITTAEGGMIVTNDAALAELCRSLRSQGRGGGRVLAVPRADGLQLPSERTARRSRSDPAAPN
ncbi:MAG: DegT/DnrJ/EryC1/StrS family aminotransferase [bacterium]|jgi:perosamine synthetase